MSKAWECFTCLLLEHAQTFRSVLKALGSLLIKHCLLIKHSNKVNSKNVSILVDENLREAVSFKEKKRSSVSLHVAFTSGRRAQNTSSKWNGQKSNIIVNL